MTRKEWLENAEKLKRKAAEVTALFTSTKYSRVCWCPHCQKEGEAYLTEQYDVSEFIPEYDETLCCSPFLRDLAPPHWRRSIITRYGYECSICGNMIDTRLEYCYKECVADDCCLRMMMGRK